MNEFIKKRNNNKQTPQWIKWESMPLIKNILIIFSIFLCSCKEEKITTLNETSDPQLVVFSEMTNIDENQVVYLSKTFTNFSVQEENRSVTGAEVYIYDKTDTIKLTESINENGAYYAPDDFIPETDETYTLIIDNIDVNNDGTDETYTAEATMGKTMKIDRMSIFYNSGNKGWKICMSGKEPKKTTNYYLFRIYRNDTLITKTLTDYRVSKDEYYNGSELKDVIVQFLDKDKDKGQVIRTNDKITLEVAGITKGYYQFLHDVKEETNDDLSFFQGPSAQIPGNISNQAMGYFAILSISRLTCIYTGKWGEKTN